MSILRRPSSESSTQALIASFRCNTGAFRSLSCENRPRAIFVGSRVSRGENTCHLMPKHCCSMVNDTDTLRHVTLDLDIHRHYFWHACPYLHTTHRRARFVPTPCLLPIRPRARRQRVRAEKEEELPSKTLARLEGDRAQGTATRSKKRASVCGGAHSRQGVV